jgi:NAD(P)-dependent dehydrogenase (short-subunit alcohol dehydrogenase family)
MSQANAGKVWFITGASRGFGALIARDALQRGDRVVATARNPQAVHEQLGDHPNLLAVRLDVTSEAEAAQAVEAAIARFSRIDVLVNNAGYGLLGAVEEASDSEVKAVFNTNVFGLLTVTRAVLPHMRKQRSGHVINMSSVAGYAAYQGWGVYGATKFAVEGLTEALAAELAPLGVRATVVEPGFFRTDFLNDNSLVSTKQQIADYAETVGVTRDRFRRCQSRAAGQSAKAGGGDARARRQWTSARAHAAWLRHGGANQREESLRRTRTRNMACPGGFDGLRVSNP